MVPGLPHSGSHAQPGWWGVPPCLLAPSPGVQGASLAPSALATRTRALRWCRAVTGVLRAVPPTAHTCLPHLHTAQLTQQIGNARVVVAASLPRTVRNRSPRRGKGGVKPGSPLHSSQVLQHEAVSSVSGKKALGPW
jgi:hypothetical protein